MHFSSLPSWFHCRVCYYLQCSSSLSQGVKQRVKKLCFGQNLFQLMYNHKPKSNAPLRKNHKSADRKGGEGVNPYGQPDRKISVFFFDGFPKPTCKTCEGWVVFAIQKWSSDVFLQYQGHATHSTHLFFLAPLGALAGLDF